MQSNLKMTLTKPVLPQQDTTALSLCSTHISSGVNSCTIKKKKKESQVSTVKKH